MKKMAWVFTIFAAIPFIFEVILDYLEQNFKYVWINDKGRFLFVLLSLSILVSCLYVIFINKKEKHNSVFWYIFPCILIFFEVLSWYLSGVNIGF